MTLAHLHSSGEKCPGGLSFYDVVQICAGHRGFVREFDRLSGHHLSQIGRRRPLDAMIDEATGRDRAACAAFVEFVWDYVWTRLPPEAFAP